MSAEGRGRSARNSLRHGIQALHGQLLPGEDANEHAAHEKSWLTALDPRNDAEAEIAADLEDAHWRLLRLDRVEHARQLQALEAEVETTPEYKRLRATERATIALTAIHPVLEHYSRGEPSRAELERLARGGVGIIELLEEVPGGLPEVRRFEAVLQTATDLDVTPDGARSACVELHQLAVAMLKALEERIGPETEAADGVRATLASSTILLEEREVKVLARYRSSLQSSIERSLVLLRALRDAAAPPAGQAQSPSPIPTKAISSR